MDIKIKQIGKHIITGITIASALLSPVLTSAQDTVKIGANYELSGDAASYGTQMLEGLELAVEEVNAIVKEASDGKLKGILGYNTEPLVSTDFNHDPHSSIFDATQTRIVGGNLVKILAWYDNEWGFSCRMLDNAEAMMAAK